jgi:hypothetical protein
MQGGTVSLLIERQGVGITNTVHHTDDDDLGIGKPVIQRVVAVKVHAQPCGEMIAAGADLRLG